MIKLYYIYVKERDSFTVIIGRGIAQWKALAICARAHYPYIESFCTQSCYIAKFPLLCIWCTVWSMEDGQYAAISGYLEHGTYPAVFTKSQRYILWKSCKNYKLLKDKLCYKEQIQDGTERDRLVVKIRQSLSRMHQWTERPHTLATAYSYSISLKLVSYYIY